MILLCYSDNQNWIKLGDYAPSLTELEFFFRSLDLQQDRRLGFMAQMNGQSAGFYLLLLC